MNKLLYFFCLVLLCFFSYAQQKVPFVEKTSRLSAKKFFQDDSNYDKPKHLKKLEVIRIDFNSKIESDLSDAEKRMILEFRLNQYISFTQMEDTLNILGYFYEHTNQLKPFDSAYFFVKKRKGKRNINLTIKNPFTEDIQTITIPSSK